MCGSARVTFILALLFSIPLQSQLEKPTGTVSVTEKDTGIDIECLAHEFRCGEEQEDGVVCIDQVRLCDTIVDCPNATDEDAQLCRSHNCPISHFKCDDGYCVPIGHICDYHPDCPDGSDENNCSYRKCWHGEWKCRNQQCINEVYLCDGQADCRDNSDEDQCRSEDFLLCGDGKKLHRGLACDGKADCVDQADERNCGVCRTDQYKCSNGRCIPLAHVCDSECDCYGTCDDEERSCGSYYDGVPGLAYCRKKTTIQCNKTNRCVHKEFICDGQDDCLDGGTDEYQCSFNQTTIAGYHCSDSRAIPVFAKCDFRRHCLMGEDEDSCETPVCSREQFKCRSGECIPSRDVCDVEPDCQDGSDELNCRNFKCPPEHFKCKKTGNCIPKAKFCDHHKDCPLDGSDEPPSCSYNKRSCRQDQFRCQNGQCIDGKLRCFISYESAKHGCLDGSHLENCSAQVCAGETWKKCRNGPCYHSSLRCNGLPDCLQGGKTWTDEEGCPFQCSSAKNCICVDVTMECYDAKLTQLPIYIEPGITKIVLSGNRLNESFNSSTLRSFHRLTLLDLSNNGIEALPTDKPFTNLWQLMVLILRNNKIRRISQNTFAGLANVRVLDLTGNAIESLDSLAFNGLSSLPQLDLSNQNLDHIPALAFVGLRNLLSLNLSGNPIMSIHPVAFSGLSNLVTLDISHTNVDWNSVTYPSEALIPLTSLVNLRTADARLCCSFGATVEKCHPKVDHFSSCADLMSNIILRVSIWVMGSVALVANVVVIYWRIPDMFRAGIHAFLIINLAIGDIIMGAYLLIIAAADIHYRGSYVYHLHEWKSSSACKSAGFLSTVSSELSILTLLVITIDRLLTILLPFHLNIRLSYTSARISMSCIWLVVLLMALAPLMPHPYFDNFYGRSGVCLALHITPERFPGWEYSIFIFLAINMLACILIILSYGGMYAFALNTQRAVIAVPQKNRKENSLARRMVIIVMTNLSCYLPISILSVLALAEINMPEEVYSWVAVFMLPVNAALNPVLYTISTRPFRRSASSNIATRAQHLRESLMASLSSGSRRRSSTHSSLSNQLSHPKSERAVKYVIEEVVPEEP